MVHCAEGYLGPSQRQIAPLFMANGPEQAGSGPKMAVRAVAIALYCQPGRQEFPGVHRTGTIQPVIARPIGL